MVTRCNAFSTFASANLYIRQCDIAGQMTTMPTVSVQRERPGQWWMHLFGVLHCMEAKHRLYKKKIFSDLRHLKYEFQFMNFNFRRMMKVPWTEHNTNEEILKMVETERKIMDTVRSQQNLQKRWLGHILRHDSLLRISLTLEGQIQGKKAYTGDQEQCSWIGYWRQRKAISATKN